MDTLRFQGLRCQFRREITSVDREINGDDMVEGEETTGGRDHIKWTVATSGDHTERELFAGVEASHGATYDLSLEPRWRCRLPSPLVKKREFTIFYFTVLPQVRSNSVSFFVSRTGCRALMLFGKVATWWGPHIIDLIDRIP